MITVPSTVTIPAREMLIDLEPVMGGAYGQEYGPGVRSLEGLRGLGDEDGFGLDEILKLIATGGTTAAQVINATQTCPAGTYKNAVGQCLPGIGPTGAYGTLQTAVGNANVGISGTTMAIMALAALVVVVLLVKK